MHSNFITPPDLIETVVIINATEEQIRACGDACRDSGRVYNVYLYHTDMKDYDWLAEVVQRSDTILEEQSAHAPVLCPTMKFGPDQDLQQPQDYFTK
jgi:hypothetical protein